MLKLPSPPSDTSKRSTPHLLPCCIHHNGPVDATPRYWNPVISEDGKLEAYFRGRKLKGREVGIPEGYTGRVVCKDDTGKGGGEGIRERGGGDGGELGEEDDEEEGGEGEALEEVASFDRVVLWGHESLVEGDDMFVKGVEEWIGFAEAMHKPGKVDGV
ncbi:hypothetical protein JMJ35_005164 [Cladonia borealis]|uniref:Uncharacterized protein n=1 Tax=Cladonia borealis TaxID=184061 RepID=A0AA39UA36_9LECA|nr:hypothetical protein JMJ35_005164 [Cladonia borealis]